MSVETAGGVMTTPVECNMTMTTKKGQASTALADNRLGAFVQVFEDRRAMSKYNVVFRTSSY